MRPEQLIQQTPRTRRRNGGTMVVDDIAVLHRPRERQGAA